MAGWLRGWFGGKRGTRAPKRASRRCGAGRALESLEERELLAGDATAQPAAAQAAAPAATAGAPPAAVAAQSGAQTNQQFIATVYQEFLNRAPDAGGAAYWSNFLASNPGVEPQLRQEMVAAVMASPEYRREVVANIYQDFLHRAPDAAGLAHWANQMSARGEDGVLSAILASPEYDTLHGGTTGGLVGGLYGDLLGRTPDASGEAYWINQFGGAATGNEATGLGLYNNGTAALIQQMLVTHEGRLLLLDNSADSAFSKLTGHGWNQLFFHGNLNHLAQNDFFAQFDANPSFDLQLQQLLAKGGYYASPMGVVNGPNPNAPQPPLDSGDVPPAGYPLPTSNGTNVA